MPKPISCAQDKSQAIPTFDCQPVEITGTTTPQPSQSTATESPAPDPSVKTLVKAATPNTTLPPKSPYRVSVLPAEVPSLDVAKAALNCPSPLSDLALIALAAKSAGLIAGFIGGFKIGADLANCLKPQLQPLQDQLTRQAAEEVCRADGGEPRGWTGNKLTCAVPPAETP